MSIGDDVRRAVVIGEGLVIRGGARDLQAIARNTMPGATPNGVHEIGGNTYGTQCGLRPYRVIVVVVPCGRAVISKQSRDGIRSVDARRKEPCSLLVRLVGHHGALGDVAIVAA